MAKRKRALDFSDPSKRAKCGRKQLDDKVPTKHVLLDRYYPDTRTLREHLLTKLPSSSRIRRRKIASVGIDLPEKEAPSSPDEFALGRLLDTTLVASRRSPEAETDPDSDLRWEQWLGFSQRGEESYVTLSGGLKGSIYSQSEIVDFVIWLLFSREKPSSWPKHLLCDGFRRHVGQNADTPAGDGIPGLFVTHPNHRVRALKADPWPQLLMLLGKAGERIMIDLLVDCAIFESVKAGKDNLYQLSGIPISDLEADTPESKPGPAEAGRTELRPSEIVLVRNRMLYARAALNARGLVHFGLRHIHVLNRFPYRRHTPEEDESTIHVMMYMFPRQFGLHNVFTSVVDRQKTAQRFQDYTLREEEIAQKLPKKDVSGRRVVHVPKRLRGTVKHLVRRLQIQHSRCAYAEVLQHYCPVSQALDGNKVSRQVVHEGRASATQHKSTPAASRPTRKPNKAKRKARQSDIPMTEFKGGSIMELATPISSISAFCQAVLSKVIPDGFWGKGDAREHNKKRFLQSVHHFIHLRRFETMCLHEVMQGMRIVDMEWLAPPGLGSQRCSQSDKQKRIEIFYEFLYYLFDSVLIPLLRSNFYITESSTHKYRLFFFRHDVWRYVAEPAMASLKQKMFEEVPFEDARRILSSRRLGFAQVRLLPKQTDMRPIMNLRRRVLPQGNKNVLGPSINSVLGPVSTMLKLEKSLHPSRLSSAMFSVGDIYPRIKAFKASLVSSTALYFAKVDVKAAFDTIPQEAILELIRRLPSQKQYRMLKHAEVQPLDTGKPSKRWHTTARTMGDASTFREMLETVAATAAKKNTAFIDGAAQRVYDARELLALATEHVQRNLVRIGKKIYRQKEGIPQGSVLSSVLCSYFYADLERTRLGFLCDGADSLLLRLIDDFLLITTDRSKAARFVAVMHGGVPEYGVTVSAGKSLVNFDLAVKGVAVPRVKGTRFPYCGLVIDTATLEVGKQRERDPVIFNALSVEYGRCPGQNFTRKVLNAFKIQSNLVFFDTAHNSRPAVLANAYSAFVETATKMWAYLRCLPKEKRPGTTLLIDTVKSLVDMAYLLLTSKSRMARYPGYVCVVKKAELAWLAMVACREVLMCKQSGYREVIVWLEHETRNLAGQKGMDCRGLMRVAGGGCVS